MQHILDLRTRRRAAQGVSDAAEIDNNSLDTVALSFHFRLQLLHLITVKGVGNILGIVVSSRRQGLKERNLPDEY